MGHPKAQIKAIKQIRLFMQLTHIQHLASRRAPRLGLFAYSLVCLCAPKAVEEIVFRNVLWALLKGHHIPGFQLSCKQLIHSSPSAAKPPALSPLFARAGRQTSPGMRGLSLAQLRVLETSSGCFLSRPTPAGGSWAWGGLSGTRKLCALGTAPFLSFLLSFFSKILLVYS